MRTSRQHGIWLLLLLLLLSSTLWCSFIGMEEGFKCICIWGESLLIIFVLLDDAEQPIPSFTDAITMKSSCLDLIQRMLPVWSCPKCTVCQASLHQRSAIHTSFKFNFCERPIESKHKHFGDLPSFRLANKDLPHEYRNTGLNMVGWTHVWNNMLLAPLC